jgi:ABC-type glutathione transport system ATPase component
VQSVGVGHSERAEIGRPGEPGPPGDFAISARGLSKLYRNNWTLKITRGLEDLNLQVARGGVLGYLGPNGAGKTTTLKLLTGLLKPTRGEAWLMGVPIASPAEHPARPIWVTMSRRRRSTRSAMTPPKRASDINGIAWKSPMRPTSSDEPVSR